MKVCIIGAGAAGCFCAVQIRRLHPDWEVTLLEAGPRPMMKLALTGGGRCNITNTFDDVRNLADVYPRGGQLIRRALAAFSPAETMAWWEAEGLPLTVQEGGRVFPACQDALEVVRLLERRMREAGVRLECSHKVRSLEEIYADRIVVTTGGGIPGFLPETVATASTIPSLFAFRTSDKDLCSLSGISVKNAALKIAGTSFRSEGDILITDWGLSGPAVLRLSSYAARELAASNWKSSLVIAWTGSDENTARQELQKLLSDNPKKDLGNVHPDGISARLWELILERAGADAGRRCVETGSKTVSRIVSMLTAFPVTVSGRCPYKDEFVTCGGVQTSAVNLSSLEAKTVPGLFFAGEVLDVDAVTGGFNLQAAWSTAMTVARHI